MGLGGLILASEKVPQRSVDESSDFAAVFFREQTAR
jgi:hypothetical protein